MYSHISFTVYNAGAAAADCDSAATGETTKGERHARRRHTASDKQLTEKQQPPLSEAIVAQALF